jgi:hypothetical protein
MHLLFSVKSGQAIKVGLLWSPVVAPLWRHFILSSFHCKVSRSRCRRFVRRKVGSGLEWGHLGIITADDFSGSDFSQLYVTVGYITSVNPYPYRMGCYAYGFQTYILWKLHFLFILMLHFVKVQFI